MDVNFQTVSQNCLEESVDVSMDQSDSDDCESLDGESLIRNLMKEVKIKSIPDDERDGEDGDYLKMGIIQKRQYQIELLEISKTTNLIICLPTNSGKTYNALKLAEYMLPTAIQKKQNIVFVANTVPLVRQQAQFFSKNLACTSTEDDQLVRAITGDLNPDIWKEKEWDKVLSYHILVMSTQILLDALNHRFICWDQIALLILDECHNARGDHAMARLMTLYQERWHSNATGLPRVLGLTATIIAGGNLKPENIPEDISNIENLLCCKAVTHKNYEQFLRQGWTIFRVPSDVTSSEEKGMLNTYFQTEKVPNFWQLWYQSKSSSAILQVRPYETNYSSTDTVCEDINIFIRSVKQQSNNFGTEQERLVIETVNEETLKYEGQLFNKKNTISQMLNLNELLVAYTELGPFCGRLAADLKTIELSKLFQKLSGGAGDRIVEDKSSKNGRDDALLDLVKTAITSLAQFIRRLEWIMKAEEKSNNQSQVSPKAWIVKHCVSNKVKVLWNILMTKRPNPETCEEDKLCGLLFCETRITTQVIRRYLEVAAKEWPDELGFLKPDIMLGQKGMLGDTKHAQFTAKLQSKVVRQFHSRQLNLLVATQVVEEGLNVPSCNLVVRFDTINTYPSFIQSLGRARKEGAICYALIQQQEEENEKEKILNFVKYNEELSVALERNAIHVGDDLDYVEPPIPPIPAYNPSGSVNGPMITAADAISLVYRYCSSLSCDKIAELSPIAWCIQRGEDQRKEFQARVLLTNKSPVREIVEGDWMPDKTLAKRSAFLKCCIRLDEEGELNEYLLPKSRSIDNFKCEFLDKLQDLHDKERETVHEKKIKIGTKKRAQWYRKYVPEKFSSRIVAHCPVFIYKVEIKLNKFVGQDLFKCLYDFEKYGRCYGIVTTANLDGLPNFVLKDSYGQLEVSVRKCLTKEKSLSSNQLQSLKNFQNYLRDGIYGVHSSVLELESQPAILIAPLSTFHDRKHGVDWKLIECLSSLDEKRLLSKPSLISRKEMKFYPENYADTILVPWYTKHEKPQFLCALGVTHLTAKSEFKDPRKARTYKEYFETKHEVQLFYPEYPLIRYKEIGTKLNFLNKKKEKEKRKEGEKTGSVKEMVPELVNVHKLPASLFVQGKYLPSILHRINRLLTANELRLKVAEHFNWNIDRDGGVLKETWDDSDEDDEVEIIGSKLEQVVLTEEKKKSRKTHLWEDVNPLDFEWDQIPDLADCSRGRKFKRSTKYAMPEPPTKKSNVCQDLIPIDKVACYTDCNFDQPTDFTVEFGPKMQTVMEALTLKHAQDSVDLEKLEVIGDSVLKLIVSLHVFRSFPGWDEGKMTQLRTKLICNLHLYQIAKKHKVGELLSGSYFIPHLNWLPSGMTVPENLMHFVVSNDLVYSDLQSLPESTLQSNALLKNHLPEIRANVEQANKEGVGKERHTTYTHSKIGDKSLADCMEAIIGAYYMHGGIDGAFRIMKYLGLRGPLEDGSVQDYSRSSTMSPIEPKPELLKKSQNVVALLSQLEKIIQYKFKNEWLAVEALTHPTFMGNRVTPCYERLEFIGDAILDFLITDWILKKTKISNPGKITDLRAALVNNVTFGSLAVKFQLHTFLKYESEQLKKFIGRFVERQEENGFAVCDPCMLLTDMESNNSVREIEVPKVLGDVFESIAGAVFVDSGMSLDTVWKVFYRLMKTELEKFSKNVPKSPLRELYERYPGKVKFHKPGVGPNGNSTTNQPKYQTVFLQISGIKGTVVGEGSTVKQAKQAAAKYVLRKYHRKK